jgi:extradiol dioxygenase family protein
MTWIHFDFFGRSLPCLVNMSKYSMISGRVETSSGIERFFLVLTTKHGAEGSEIVLPCTNWDIMTSSIEAIGMAIYDRHPIVKIWLDLPGSESSE